MMNRMRDASAQLPQTHELKSAVIKSTVFHVVFILILTVRAYFFPSEPLQIESAIRVDIVGLPEKTAVLPAPIIEPPKPEVSSPPTKELPPIVKEIAKPIEPVILKPTKPDLRQQKKNQEAALKRLDAMSRLTRQAKVEAVNKAFDDAKNRQTAVRGNQISKGGALSGLTRLDHAKYLDGLEARIKHLWRPPKFLTDARLRVRVLVFIDSDGSILRKQIVQTSGNSVFDESALAAVESAMPLPAPPESLHGVLANQGVELDLEPNGFR